MRNIDLFTSLLTAVVRCAGVISCSDNVFIQKDEFSQYVSDIWMRVGVKGVKMKKKRMLKLRKY